MTYKHSVQVQVNKISSALKLKHMSRNTCYGQKFPYLTPKVWNYLPTIQKLSVLFIVSRIRPKIIFSETEKQRASKFSVNNTVCAIFNYCFAIYNYCFAVFAINNSKIFDSFKGSQ